MQTDEMYLLRALGSSSSFVALIGAIFVSGAVLASPSLICVTPIQTFRGFDNDYR